VSLRSWFRGLFATPLRVSEAGDEGAEAEADLGEELPAAEEDRESLHRAEYAGDVPPEAAGSKLELEFEPKTIAFEGAEAEAGEQASEGDSEHSS